MKIVKSFYFKEVDTFIYILDNGKIQVWLNHLPIRYYDNIKEAVNSMYHLNRYMIKHNYRG